MNSSQNWLSTSQEVGTNPAHGRILVLIAALMWSTSGFFVKSPWFQDWPGYALAFWRAVFASIVLLPMVKKFEWNWRLVPTTLIFAAMNYTYLSTMAEEESSIAIWLQYVAPVWIVIIGILWLNERVTKLDWVMVGLQMTGVAVILSMSLSGGTAGQYFQWMMVGFTYALVVLSLRWVKDMQAAWVIAINHIVTSLVFLPKVISEGIYPDSVGGWIAIACFGMFQMGIPYCLFAIGLKHIPGHEATGILLLEPVLVPVWVFVAWSHLDDYQSPDSTTLVGATLILSGLVCRYWGEIRQPKPIEVQQTHEAPPEA